MPVPPAKVRATKPTRHSSGSIPLYSARPPQTPPSIESPVLRCSPDRGCGGGGGGGDAGGGHVGGSTGGAGGGAEVMAKAWPPGRRTTIREPTHSTLVPLPG